MYFFSAQKTNQKGSSYDVFELMDEEFERKRIEVKAMEALGCGFDFASDFRLKFVKRCPNGGRLVILDESNRRNVVIPGGVTIPDVSENIRCDKGDHIRFKSDVLEFNQVSIFNLPFNDSLLGLIFFIV